MWILYQLVFLEIPNPSLTAVSTWMNYFNFLSLSFLHKGEDNKSTDL